MKLYKGEKSLWQMPSDEIFLIADEKECDVECFMLTSENIRIEYFKKLSFFKKELVEIVIPLDLVKIVGFQPQIYYSDYENDTIKVIIESKNQDYEVMIPYTRKKECEKHLNEFIEKVSELLKKNSKIIDTPIEISSFPVVITERNNSPYISQVEMVEIRNFLYDLGPSKTSLNDANNKKIYSLFPVPKEHNIIWADCEFDLRCSGIVCTDKGCFIKSNVSALDEKKKSKKAENNGKSILYYYKWSNFSPSFFTKHTPTNYVLSVDPQCQPTFLSVCKKHDDILLAIEQNIDNGDIAEFNGYVGVVAGVTAGIAAAPNANLEFMDQYIRNVNGRHGFFAEQANNMTDIAMGRRATVIGGDNAKNGADRLIQRVVFRDVYIQTKYCKTPEATLNAGFGRDGLYKYVNETAGIMQLEVPSDQYHSVVEGFKEKIRQGKVVDANGKVLTNPDLATKYVRKGHYTYEQTVKMAEPGNIESIKYDIKTGMVSCMFAFGISSLLTMVISYKKNKDLSKAISDGLKVGIKVFGLTMINHVLLSQLYRTTYFQNFTGNILLRNTLVTSGVSLIVYSIPDIINLLANNISFGQFVKNTVILGAGIAGGAGGAALGGTIGKAIGGRTGEAIGSILGGLVGGIGGSLVAKAGTDIVKEDDTQIFSRFFSATISSMVIDYMLDESELEMLSEKLNKLDGDDIKSLAKKYRKASNQESVVVEYLTPLFKDITKKRKKFAEPKDDLIAKGFVALA